jgi:hypothetical protein
MKNQGTLNEVPRLTARQDGSKSAGEGTGLNAENSSVLRPTSKCFLLTFLFIGRPISRFPINFRFACESGVLGLAIMHSLRRPNGS